MQIKEPDNRKKKKLLVVVDMQNDFIDGALGTPQAQKIVTHVAERIKQAADEGETIVYTRDTHSADYPTTLEGKLLPVPHCIAGTHGHEISDRLPLLGKIIDKPTFGSVELGRFAQENKFEEAELIGLCTDICVLSNAMLLRAFCPEMQVSVRADCCAGVTPDSHETALNAMKNCQVRIL